jgi:IstB-like ATP binding protein
VESEVAVHAETTGPRQRTRRPGALSWRRRPVSAAEPATAALLEPAVLRPLPNMSAWLAGPVDHASLRTVFSRFPRPARKSTGRTQVRAQPSPGSPFWSVGRLPATEPGGLHDPLPVVLRHSDSRRLLGGVRDRRALVAALAKAHAEGRLEERLSFFAKPKLLIVNELGYLPFETQCRASVLSADLAPL